MSTTPRTDAIEERNGNVLCGSANLKFARTLERELAAEREKVRMLTNNLRDLITAVTYADPPRLFNGVLCHEARVPVEFVDDSRKAIDAAMKEGSK